MRRDCQSDVHSTSSSTSAMFNETGIVSPSSSEDISRSPEISGSGVSDLPSVSVANFATDSNIASLPTTSTIDTDFMQRNLQENQIQSNSVEKFIEGSLASPIVTTEFLNSKATESKLSLTILPIFIRFEYL